MDDIEGLQKQVKEVEARVGDLNKGTMDVVDTSVHPSMMDDDSVKRML